MIAAALLMLKGFGSTLWRFGKSPAGRYILAALAVMLALFLVRAEGHRAGVRAEQAAQGERDAAAGRRIAKLQADSARISRDARTKNDQARADIAALTIKLQQKVPTYVSPQADRRCVVPVGYVRLRDAAGAGVDPVPGTAGGSLDADSGLVLSDLAANDLTNAAAFRTAVDEVKAWRGWYAAQAELRKQTIKAPEPAP